MLVEGLRPGVTERLGLGPDACLARNPRLVYGRMTGWGQTGPLAQTAGHDLDYVAVTGALFGLGQDPARPHFPTNLVGDFGGGSTYLVIGVLAALLEARVSGQRPGRRRGHRRRRRPPQRDGRQPPGRRAGDRTARGQPARRRRPVLRPLRDRRRPAPRRRRARAAVLRRASSTLLGIADSAPDRDDPAKHPALRDADRRDRSHRGPWPSGPRSSTAPTPASRRCCRSARRSPPAPRRPGQVYVDRDGAPNPPRHRASPAPRPRSARRRPPRPAPTPATPWPPGASPTSTP